MYLKRDIYKEILNWKYNWSDEILELSGARQVGKTFIINKFADENYKSKIYINMLESTGKKFLKCYTDYFTTCENVSDLFKLFDPTFVDTKDTVIIIDEIQESPTVYNMLREFNRNLKSNIIISGSYLGRILKKDFKYSSGDIYKLNIGTLNFREFLDALDEASLLDNINIYGKSSLDSYKKLEALYNDYKIIGGYPAVVLHYIRGDTLHNCRKKLLSIIDTFCNESKRYFDDILDITVYDNIFCSIARIPLKEKKGFIEDSFSEELQKLIIKDYSSSLDKATCNRAIDWLKNSGIVGYCAKVIKGNILDFKVNSRCYFMDLGIASYFYNKVGADTSTINGLLNENFIYLDLYSRINSTSEIAFEMPAFATFNDGELDFFVKSLHDNKIYGIEVKSGKNSGKTAKEMLDKKVIDFLINTKGASFGGINNNIYTIPIYTFSKFTFDKGASSLRKLDLFES